MKRRNAANTRIDKASSPIALQANALFGECGACVGLDVHKDKIAVAVARSEREAEGSGL